MEASTDPVRVDKWLWAARLVKTRPDGADAVKGGRVHVNGKSIKPSRDVGPGDRLELVTGPFRRTVIIKATAERRGPASLAVQLYDETPESIEKREAVAAERRAEWADRDARTGRPTKRDRRRIEEVMGDRARKRRGR